MSQKRIYNDVAISGSLAVDSSTNSVDIQCDTGLALNINATNGDGLIVESTGRGAYINTTNGIGAVIESQNGIGANIISNGSIGLEVFTNATGENYNVKIGKPTGSKILGISSPGLSLDWTYTANSKVAKLKAPDTLSDNHVWTLPDTTGTIVLDSTIASLVTGLSGYGKTILVDAETGVSDRTGISQYSGIPFATIAAAVAASASGDLIYVRAGSYIITSTINLTSKGTLYFEYGTRVTINEGTVFSMAPTGGGASVYGNAMFQLYGDSTLFAVAGIGAALNFECLGISASGATNSDILFDINSTGAVINIKIKQSVFADTFIDIKKSADSILIDANTISCNRFLNSVATVIASITTYIKKLTVTSGFVDGGIKIANIGLAKFYIDEYEHDSIGLYCDWTENSQTEKIEFINTRWKSSNNVSHISATTTAAAMTTKTIRLIGNNTFCGITNATNSITSTQLLDVYVQNAYAATAAHSNIKFKVGLFTVDTDVNNFNN
jgi:hypothetical protein